MILADPFADRLSTRRIPAILLGRPLFCWSLLGSFFWSFRPAVIQLVDLATFKRFKFERINKLVELMEPG